MTLSKSNGKLVAFFEGTEPTLKDWLANFRFWKLPYKNMGVLWLVHAGFLGEWKRERDEFAAALTDDVHTVEIHGLSQGGAVAVLAHEFVWFTHPRLRSSLKTTTYGAPRCIGWWGFWRIMERFAGVRRVKNRGDYVTCSPPVWLGYLHVGELDLRGRFTLDIRKSHGGYKISF